MKMKRRTRIALIAAATLFALLFTLRLVSKLSPTHSSPGQGYNFNQKMSQNDSSSFRKGNYASERIVVRQGSGQQVVDQKYERIADMRATSRNFDSDVVRLREIATKVDAVIQRENAFGLAGSRTLSLALGIVPANFDSTVEAVRRVGKLDSISVTKTDRTTDFKALEAKRLSLEKARDGLKALRTAGAALSDLVALETKILEIEGQIQELGVSLGDYTEANSFCTIEFSLSEDSSRGDARILVAILESFGWAILVEVGVAALVLAASGIAALLAMAYARFRKAQNPAA